MLNVLILLIAAACLVALFNWRWGILAAILVSLLQDPLRKVIPGVPAYLVLASAPIWICAMLSAAFRQELSPHRFLNGFPRVGLWIQIFAAYLLIPAAISATYGRNSWMITLLGAFIYAMLFLILVAGWQYPRRGTAPELILIFYALAGALMLIGGPLEALGNQGGNPFVGTEMLGHVWVTYRTGAALHMIAGFFRSPDVMGWHATLIFMVSVILAFRYKGPARWIWIAVAVWGGLNIWLCGRRKMLSMIPIFIGCYSLLVFRFKNVQKILSAAGTALLIGGIGWYLISALFRTDVSDRFYLSTLAEAEERIQIHGFRSVATTVHQAGFWGYGLGMSQQGIHNLSAETPRLWQESGPSKMVAELGVPGNLLFGALGVVLFITAYQVVRMGQRRTSFYLTAGILSILAANSAASVVSAQIFGDPLVVFLLAFLMGLLLSDARNGGSSLPPSAADVPPAAPASGSCGPAGENGSLPG